MFFCGRFHRGAAEVLVLTATGAIGNGNDADDNLHFLSRHPEQSRGIPLRNLKGKFIVDPSHIARDGRSYETLSFFTNRTSEISISLSIALHMS